MTIAGSDSGGGAGLQADLRTFAALGMHATSVITAITAQNTREVLEVLNLPATVVSAQMDAIFSDIPIRSVKTGMLGTVDIAEAVSHVLSRHNVPLVVDPIAAAETGGSLVIGDLREVVAKLLPMATVVTPNLSEAKAISGVTIRDLEDMKRAAREIYALGPKSVIVTGGHLNGTDVLYDGDFKLLRGHLVAGETHGAGCTFSAALAAYLTKGYAVRESALFAKAFVTTAIKRGERIGSGSGPVNQVSTTLEMAERYQTLLNIEAGLSTIKAINLKLVPEGGSNLAMAISCAKRPADVAGVRGGIKKVGDRIAPIGCIEFGASRQLARVILVALQYDANTKAAMNVRCSDEMITACRGLDLIMEGFDQAREPGEASTSASQIAQAIERGVSRGVGVPDIIYNRGAGKKPIVFLLGESAQKVAETVVKISSALS